MEKKAENLHLSFRCTIDAPFETVSEGFNIDLFRALCPAFPKVSIERFDGIRQGDLVSLKLGLFLLSWQWSGTVISYQRTDNELRFVDTGDRLPPFLSYWKHEHLIIKNGKGTVIEDNIEFRAGKGWPDFLVKMMISLQMKPRKKIYRNYFEKNS